MSFAHQIDLSQFVGLQGSIQYEVQLGRLSTRHPTLHQMSNKQRYLGQQVAAVFAEFLKFTDFRDARHTTEHIQIEPAGKGEAGTMAPVM